MLGFFLASITYAQQAQVEGIVFDRNTKQRIGKVLLENPRSKVREFNNTRGEFHITALPGDTLIASSRGYYTDTLVVTNNSIVLFHLLRESIYIDEVTVIGKRSAEEQFKQAQRDYEKAFRLSDPGDLFSVGPNGVGLSINAIYSLFSKEAKNAKRLKKLLENDYRENKIDDRFSVELVSKTTGLSGEELQRFMRIFRPSYYLVQSSNDYQLATYIRLKYDIYRKNPNAFRIESLPIVEIKGIP